MKQLRTLRPETGLSSEYSCIGCGQGETAASGPMVQMDGEWIHYYRCLNRGVQPPKDVPAPMEQATAAPGEVRNVKIPPGAQKPRRQPKRPPRQ